MENTDELTFGQSGPQFHCGKHLCTCTYIECSGIVVTYFHIPSQSSISIYIHVHVHCMVITTGHTVNWLLSAPHYQAHIIY